MANEIKNKFKVRDRVFAKIRGYPQWPAVIDSIENSNSKILKYNVTFYGTKEVALVKEVDLCSFNENKDRFGKPKQKNQLLNKAIKEAEKSFNTSVTLKQHFTYSQNKNITAKQNNVNVPEILPATSSPLISNQNTYITNKNETSNKFAELPSSFRKIENVLGPNMCTDDTIWEYLEIINNKVLNTDEIICINPIISQAVKMFNDFNYILDPLNLKHIQYHFIPVNDCVDIHAEGGSHWSFLLYTKETHTFFYYDSIKEYNLESAKQVANKWLNYLEGSTSKCAIIERCSTPQQDNSIDCGIYMLAMMEVLISHLLNNGLSGDSWKHLILDDLTNTKVITKRSQIAYIFLNKQSVTSDTIKSLFLTGRVVDKIKELPVNTNYSKIVVNEERWKNMPNRKKGQYIKKDKLHGIYCSNRFNGLQQEVNLDKESPALKYNTNPVYSKPDMTNKRNEKDKLRHTFKHKKNNKLVWKNPKAYLTQQNKETKIEETVIVGDSMLKYMKPKNCKMMVFPGINSTQLQKKISKIKNEQASKHKTVIVHVGTNDLHRFMSPDEVMGRVYSLIGTVKNTFVGSNIVVNSIVHRRDVNRRLVDQTNDRLRWVCHDLKVLYSDVSRYLDNTCLARDGLHLNRRGVYILEKVISNVSHICNGQGNL